MRKLLSSTLLSFLILVGIVFPSLNVSANQKVTTSALGFTDLSSEYTFINEISYLTSKGGIAGFPDGTFRPNNTVTRAQAIIMIGRALGWDGEPRNTIYPDVTSNVTGSGYIASASEKGILDLLVFESGSFAPTYPVNREEMAILIDKAFTLATSQTNSFNDVSSLMTAYQSILNVSANGIASGYPDGTYRPDQSVTRGQFSAFLTRTLEPSFRSLPTIPKNDENLSTSEIAQLNDQKVVLIEVNVRNGISQGSGIIVGNGLVLTNEHVINGMSGGTITLNDGREYEIEGIVISDKIKDLALVKTTEEILNVDPVDIGTYKSLEKGEKIVTIGSPYGLQNTVSEGIVSSFRIMEGVQLIQISAPIDHGSSGGGLFNSKGELVGITSSGYENSNADLNFAVAIDEASSWYSYFNMEFDDIEVVSSQDITLIPVFGDIALGMTKEQVKSLETATLFSEEPNQLTYTDEWVFDYSAGVVYEFENNRLVSINIFHDVVNNQGDLVALEAYFEVMYNNLTNIYGEASSLDTNWYDDDDGYVLSALWEAEGHDTYLISQVLVDYSSYGGIRISTK